MAELILCVGRLREEHWRAACAEYQKRLSRYGKLEIVEVDDLPEPEHASDADREKIKRREGEALLRRIRPGDHVVALCIDAPQLTSEALADFVAERERSGGRTVYVIGGSLGLSGDVISRADRKLSMSRMTFPHQLARVMLLEQLYRSRKILAGERYHK